LTHLETAVDRFYLQADAWGNPAVLQGDEAHHCVRVMRKKAGDRVILFDGGGREAEAVIRQATKSGVELEMVAERRVATLYPEIEIAVGVPKGKTFELILQKAVEMGVSRIHPLLSDQGNVRFHEEESRAKQLKWDRVVLEACKQCGQNFLPQVSVPRSVEGYLGQAREGEGRFVAALIPEARPFREVLAPRNDLRGVGLMIGPEGDFSKEQYGIILDAGFAPVDLGNLVLRTETAVFAMLAAVRYQFQV
jgi:16S rRNA (uracil1498-N3)-methyltransferase